MVTSSYKLHIAGVLIRCSCRPLPALLENMQFYFSPDPMLNIKHNTSVSLVFQTTVVSVPHKLQSVDNCLAKNI